jgi:hypothetical protein|uniref:Uncharacterized protein n=1 Tax=Siphoviridae sp. ctDwe1 TaxID=2826200 RepID=A0A8S5M674_9CAUD|nr:MAG TPA: hypothetical protein [Siphoviridae sp. ctDwe1]
MAPNYTKKKRGESSPFLNTAVCRAFSFCFLFGNAIIKETNVRGNDKWVSKKMFILINTAK